MRCERFARRAKNVTRVRQGTHTGLEGPKRETGFKAIGTSQEQRPTSNQFATSINIPSLYHQIDSPR